VRIPGGIRVRLALALLVIVGGALATAYAIVVPSLRENLVNAKLEKLSADAGSQAMPLFPAYLYWQEFAETWAFPLNARVVVYNVLTDSPPAVTPNADSRGSSSVDVERDEIALRALASGHREQGTVRRGSQSYAEVAFPVASSGAVVLFSSSLADQEASVELVKKRLLAAAGVALFVALALGTAAAGMHARRIRRLERAANRIAGGHFDEPVVDTGDDELGELAQAFERMRVQLAQLDSARKEFIANASHELRTPLFSLGGFLELMTDEELDEATRSEFLITMREQVERLTKLATDLLDLSRVDAGRLRVERDRIELREIARSLADELRAVAETRGHPLELDAELELTALGDEERVLQIGRALAGNALVHTPPGTRVTIRVTRRNGRSALEVIDDGPGISPEHVARVFDRFYRVEGGLASGSGLGLAIARELAELMGGRVTLESQPGQTVFAVELEPAAGRVEHRELAPA
jgi:signal transduction histidine kinase